MWPDSVDDNVDPTDAISPAVSPEHQTGVSRRSFLRSASVTLATGSLAAAALAQGQLNAQDKISLPQLHAASEAPEKIPGPFEAPSQRIGFAVVGLGHLSLGQILPAMGKSKYCRVTALVSGDRDKARKVAAQFGVPESGLYDYQSYDQLAQNKDLPSDLHRPSQQHARRVCAAGAKAGKHILCEKPMATNARDCERMIAACKAAKVKLMIAYRQQYKPMNRAIVKMVRSGKTRQAAQLRCQQLAKPGRSKSVAPEDSARRRWGPSGCRHLLPQRSALSYR